MAPSLYSLAVLAIAALSVDACNFHTRRSTTRFSNPHTGTIYKRAEEEIDFGYVDSFDWHTIKEGQPLPYREITTHMLTSL